jgi:hypothetical protein
MSGLHSFTTAIVLALLFTSCVQASSVSANFHSSLWASLAAEKYMRTELYFGFGKKDGTEVTDAEWETFLAAAVTPRFPEGFTAVQAIGQYRDSSGKVIRERSRMLILLYPKKSRRVAEPKIEAIRHSYTGMFGQESVLRVDLRHSVKVDF